MLSIPIYVTRPTANGTVGSWSINGYVAMALLIAALVNAGLWSVVGVIIAIGIIT